jgi:hypothetical protein
MRYELIEGDTELISRLANDGWVLINTFPNPSPMPYFFALMQLTSDNANDYDVQKARDFVYSNTDDNLEF